MGGEREEQGRVANTLLDGCGLSVVDAVRLALEMQEVASVMQSVNHTPMAFCRHIIRLGAEAYAQEANTVTFREAMERSLQSRASRRLRTLSEIRQHCRRFLLHFPELADMPMRAIRPEFCRRLIEEAFHTASTRVKARRMLNGIFTFSLRHGWCACNPLDAVEFPVVCERPIDVLTIGQVRRLLATARRREHLPCAPAVGIMLWAGIRPTEVARLRWEDVHMEERIISIAARHSKTGGERHVTLHPVLFRWLNETATFRLPRALITPRAWDRRWRVLRRAAGFSVWNPDALRHTYASYHLKFFRDIKALQIDMGHANTQLLRTRYLGMKGITWDGVCEFWGGEARAEEPGGGRGLSEA